MTSWRPALRIARRSVRRAPGRSLLIAVLVALPVAGAAMVDVLARTYSSPERRAQQELGSADAAAIVTASSRLGRFSPPATVEAPSAVGRPDRDPADVDLPALLPRGSRVVEQRLPLDVRLALGERVVRTSLYRADPREPLERHLVELTAGRAPRAPDELLVSPSLAERLRARPGSRLRSLDGIEVTVSGLGRQPYCHGCDQLTAPAGSVLEEAAERPVDPAEVGERRFLVDLPDGVDPDDLWPSLARQGVALIPREAVLHPERYGVDPAAGGVDADDVRGAAMALLLVGLALLEVVLLAGTAFAVGARRQTRDLGLVGAAGGTGAHVRRIVLAQGVVLGALGAVLGVAAGIALALAGRPLWERVLDGDIGPWTFAPLELAGAALLGVVAGLLAALAPAAGAARMRVVDALADRIRPAPGRRRRRRALTAGLLVAGVGLSLAGRTVLAGDLDAYSRALAEVKVTGAYVAAPSPAGPVGLILLGVVALVAGIVLAVPALIGRLSGLGARLPVAVRLAVRDAARNRHRAGPATTAVAVATAVSVALAFLVAGAGRAQELQYVPALPERVLEVGPGDGDANAALRAAQAAAAELPGAEALPVRVPLRRPERGEALGTGPSRDAALQVYVRQTASACPEGCAAGPVALASTPALHALAAGRAFPPAATAALGAGRAVVFDERLLDRRGRVTLEAGRRLVRVPATVVERDRFYGLLPSVLVPAAVARDQAWRTPVANVFVTYGADATRTDVDTAIVAAERRGGAAFADEGPDYPGGTLLAVLAVVAGLVTLAGVAISVALAAAEGRADLATLAAVGADPRRRRALSAAQALLVAGLGCALGVAFGTYVAVVSQATTGSPDLVVPWANLAVTGLAVPLVAVLVAAAVTPARLPLVRRLA